MTRHGSSPPRRWRRHSLCCALGDTGILVVASVVGGRWLVERDGRCLSAHGSRQAARDAAETIATSDARRARWAS